MFDARSYPLGNVKEFFAKFWAQFSLFWGSLNTPKKLGLVGGIIAIGVGAIALIMSQRQDPYEYLVTNISAEDAQAITTLLKKSGKTDYIIDDKGLKVPIEQITPLRLQRPLLRPRQRSYTHP